MMEEKNKNRVQGVLITLFALTLIVVSTGFVQASFTSNGDGSFTQYLTKSESWWDLRADAMVYHYPDQYLDFLIKTRSCESNFVDDISFCDDTSDKRRVFLEKKTVSWWTELANVERVEVAKKNARDSVVVVND